MSSQTEQDTLKPYLNTLHSYRLSLQTLRHRGVVVVQGDADWQQEVWQALCQTASADLCLQVGGPSQPERYRTIPLAQTRHLLGQEAQHAFLSATHADAGMDLDALGIISGLLTPGGLCLIGLPPEPTWPHVPNPAALKYLNTPHTAEDLKHGFNHFLSQTLHHTTALWLKPNTPPDLPTGLMNLDNKKPQKMSKSPVLTPHSAGFKPNTEQQQAIERILRVATGHRRRPLLLTADRGRGKSTALGFAIAELFQHGKRHIGLTAARKAQAQIVLNTLQKTLTQQQIPFQTQGHTLTAHLPTGEASVHFYAPDALLQSPPTLDLLIVEEAAHLPLPVLTKLLQHFHRLVFATTLHGYEGSGRGFSLKLNALLQQHTDSWQQQTLLTPIRWAENDPLEHFIQRLYLQAPTQTATVQAQTQTSATKPLIFTQETPHTLWQTPAKLTAIFQLLVEAHYQTRPNDLLQLLEAPDLKLWCAWQGDALVGTLLATQEGRLPIPKSDNTNDTPPPQRYHGHLVPQQLYTQSLHPDWLTLNSWRIMRLAVAPHRQNQGIGTQLVQHALQHASKEAVDFVSTSFGATPELIRFWQKSAFTPLYLGLKQDKASASHALTLAHALSPTAQSLIQGQLTDYRPQFADLLSRTFQHLDPDLLLALLNAFHYPRQKLPTGYLLRSKSQPFEAISVALKAWALSHPDHLQHWPREMRTPFLRLVCQHHNWSDITHHSPFNRQLLEKEWKRLLSWHT